MEGDTSVEFALPAKAENVALVRHALSGFAEVLGMEGGDIADLKTVVTEACTNVVAHAYEPGTAGRSVSSSRFAISAAGSGHWPMSSAAASASAWR